MDGFLLRRLVPADLVQVKALCVSSFPIEYPQCWYDEVVGKSRVGDGQVSGGLFSLGIFDGQSLVGLLVAEFKPLMACNTEDRHILADQRAYVVYILSLAVSTAHRRKGIATRLLDHLVATAGEAACRPRAMFLHVLATNEPAIRFYHRNGFVHFETLLNYYRLTNGFGHGYTYVLYVNGGHKPFSVFDFCQYFSNFLCSPMKLFKGNYP